MRIFRPRLPGLDRGLLPWVLLSIPAACGAALGVLALQLYLTEYPLADVHAYYEAATRLNAGLPLYDHGRADHAGLYLNPPLLAVMFRPLALLPFPVAAVIWEALILASFALTLWRIGLRPAVVLVIAMLAMPIVWALSIGQAEVLITLLLTYASPLTIALAGHIKLAPWLVGIWWLARGDLRSVARLAGWIVALGVVQLVLEPAGTLAYLRLEWLQPAFTVRNLSPFAIHPLLWAGMVAVLLYLAVTRAKTRWGWPLAVALAVLVYPRLLAYQLMTLLAAFGGPRYRPRDAAPAATPASPAVITSSRDR
jgi:hypothetical protein